MIESIRSSNITNNKDKNQLKGKRLKVSDDFAMTITNDYTVIPGHHHPEPIAFGLPFGGSVLGVWCGEHIRFAEEELLDSPGKKPHGLFRGSRSGGRNEQGAFWMKVDGNVICNVGSSKARKWQEGKSLSELGCNALEVGISPRGRHKCFVCQCDPF